MSKKFTFIHPIFVPGRRVFSLVVLTYLGWLVFINALMFLPALGLLPDNALSAMGHFGKFLSTGDTHDLIHELVFALIVGTAAIGLLSQLWKPKEKFAGQLVALIVWGAMILTAAFTNNWVPQPLFIIFGGLTILATVFHPARRDLLNWFSVATLNKTLLTLVIAAAIPLLAFTFTNIGLQTADGGNSGFFEHNPPTFHGGDSAANQEPSQNQPLDSINEVDTDNEADHDQKHIALGHYRNIAVLALLIILVGILASFKPGDWRLAAWVAGFLPILFGLASIILPNAESSLGVIWSLVAIVWGVVFVAVAELTKNAHTKHKES
ncbi:hypothetical protein HYX10_02685 [Candidatus Woesearchaeota archaeon]|nr:hypothetical protein [Candidatus Woesearchaeota archaeon]